MKNFEEKWTKWNPSSFPEGEYIVTEFYQNLEGTKLTLEEDEKIATVFFDGIPYLVREAIEGLRMRTWVEVQKKYNNQSFFRCWFLYVVDNSELVKWAKEESCGFYDMQELKHFCIVTGEEMVDILATFEPLVTIADK